MAEAERRDLQEPSGPFFHGSPAQAVAGVAGVCLLALQETGAPTILVGSMSQQSKTQRELASVRDTVESIWVAIVLAFVLRAFVLEAFVIPTGSMAERLYGEHLDLCCPACGREFAYGFSDHREQRRTGPGNNMGNPEKAVCPTCGYDRFQTDHYISGGDRVLVMKYLYRFQEPKPWDVIVFKNPQDNKENYIKRLIGLPGEAIEIVHGNIFVRRPGQKEFRIRRKDDPKTQAAMWQVVFDNDFRPQPGVIEQANLGQSDKIVPPRWEPAGRSPLDARWAVRPDDPNTDYGRVFRFAGTDGGQEATLALWSSDPVRMFLPRYGYNSRPADIAKTDIVSDLKLQCAWRPSGKSSKLALMLSSFEYLFRGEVTGDGEVRLLFRPLSSDGAGGWRLLAKPVRLGPLANGRGHVVSLQHVDLGASVWIDGERVATSVGQSAGPEVAGYPMDYDWIKNRLALARKSENAKPVPVPAAGIAASGARAELEHVALLRDVYYTTPRINSGVEAGSEFDFIKAGGVELPRPGWGTEGHPIVLGDFDDPDLDQFFVLGDNSPESLDGRLWVKAAASMRLYDDSGLRGDPNLAVGDVNWTKLLQALRRPTTNDTSSAAAYVRSRLSPETRTLIASLTRSQIEWGRGDDELERTIVSELNGMIASPDTFDRRLWLSWGVTPAGPAGPLADAKEAGKALTPFDLRRLNRLALEVALPESISGKWRVYQLGTVPRYSLIGKAIFVYWPSGFRLPFAPHLPIIPNVGRMRLIR